MSSPARYWVVVFICSAILCACGGRSVVPLPFAAQAGPAANAAVDESTAPNLQACSSAKLQPGWVFRGACKVVTIERAGTLLRLPWRSGFTMILRVPRNDARTRQRITIANAIPGAVLHHAGHAFPEYKDAFLYFKTYDDGRIIRLRQRAGVTFDITSATTTFGAPCAIARLERSAWKTLPISGTVSGKSLKYSIKRSSLAAIPHGAAYFAFACQTAPSPSPSPSASPTTSPTASPTSTPAACASYSVPGANTVQVNVQDGSGLGGSVIMYVWNGSSWLNNAGAFAAASPYPIPLACFPGSAGSAGTHFALPPNVSAGRLYISYATSTSLATVPNPLASMAPGGPPPSYGGPYWNVPWDVVEFGTTPGAVIDLTAVTDLGLPMEMTQSPPGKAAPAPQPAQRPRPGAGARTLPAPCPTSGAGIVGVTSCNYANIYTAMSSLPQYQNLVATGKFKKKIIDLRIINPSKAATWNFGLDWFYNPSYLGGSYPPQCAGVPTPLANGYLSCVLASYASAARLYATNGSGAAGISGDNYCVSSDGSANFGFTDVKTATSCAGITYTSPNTFPMPIALFEYGTPPVKKDGTGCDAGFLFGLPPNNNWIIKGKSKRSPNVFATGDAFAVWKGLALDINRGAALSTNAHPAGGWAQNFASPAPFTDYYNDPLYNDFAYVLHYYYDHHQSYALSYDEPGGQASAFSYIAGDAIDITVNKVPTASAVSPVASPSPYPTPATCPVFPTNIGG